MSEEEKPQNKLPATWMIVGYNLIVLVFYTLICKLIDGGAILDAFILVIHFVVCLILSLVMRSWYWVLAAFVVVAIGFSTCVGFLSLGNMH
jgi:hypothetical protein